MEIDMTMYKPTPCFLGTFKGYNCRERLPVPYLLTAKDVVQWDHDTDGETTFVASGDVKLVECIFNCGEVWADDILDLCRLVSDLGGSPEDALMRILFACEKFEQFVADLTVEQLNHRRPMTFSGATWQEVHRAAFLWMLQGVGTESPAGGTTDALETALRDPEAFLASPDWLTMELLLGDRCVVMVLKA